MPSPLHIHGRLFYRKSSFHLIGGVITQKYHKIIKFLTIILVLACFFAFPSCAITEAEVEQEVAEVGKETVTGNLLIWFLCAVAFLKVSQKIDSFMSALGVNVGHTGGSLLAEVMIAAKTVSTVASSAGHLIGGEKSSGSPGAAGAKGADGSSFGFLRGGLAGVAVRKATNDAVKTATSTKHTSAAHTTAASSAAAHSATRETATMEHSVHTDQSSFAASTVQQEHASQTNTQSVGEHDSSHTTHTHSTTLGGKEVSSQPSTAGPGAAVVSPPHHPSIGAAVFMSSLQKGGDFANNVIGRVAKGDIRTAGSITGDMAAQSMMSYMGYTALGEKNMENITFREVEIGGGRITGVEVTPQHPEGVEFGMYHVDQYTRPEGDYSKVTSADGAQWYKQYAADSVKKTPYKAPDGEVAYRTEIISKLPQPPKRKDRV